MKRRGMSMLELVVAATILAILVASVFDLFTMQRHEVAASERGLFLHARAVQRLAEEESRLSVSRFASPATPATSAPSNAVGDAFPFTEALSVAPSDECTGLYKVTVNLSYTDESNTARTLTVTKLVVDRDRLTRLPASVRGAP